MNRGNVFGMQGRRAEALDRYHQCLARQPAEVEVLCNCGKVLMKARTSRWTGASHDRASRSIRIVHW